MLTSTGNINHCSFLVGDLGPQLKAHALTLDGMLNDNKITNIDFIHLDVEGYEFKVILGATQLIQKYMPIIAFEQHIDKDDVHGLSNYLRNFNYEVYIINEILPGCYPDCRNLLAIPTKTNINIQMINSALNKEGLLTKI
jgi:hypothetical protein